MEKIKKFFKDLGEYFKNAFRNGKELYENNKRVFYQIDTKAVFGLLFGIGLLFPLFIVKNIFGGVALRFNGFDMPLGWLWVILLLVLPVLIAIMSLNKKFKKAAKIYKITSIFSVVFYAWLFINYIVAATDSAIPAVNIGFGFILVTLSFIAIILLTWKEALIMGWVYKIFKIPEIEEVEYVNDPVEEPVEDKKE